MTHTEHHAPEGSDPEVEQFEADDDDEGTTPWGWFGSAAIAVVIAVLCFTPLWDELAPGGRETGRRAGFSNLLHAIGPIPIALGAAALAVIFVIAGVRRLRADHSESR